MWLIAVVFGCLGLIGISLSAVSAQRHCRKVADFTANLQRGNRSRTARGRRSSGGRKPPDVGDGPAASYSRYSSENQRETSITDQQRKCREAAERNGHQIESHFEFGDSEISGTVRDRGGLNALLAAAERREFKVLYFHNLSRLARESVISMPVLKTLVHVNRVRVISVTEGIDSDRDGWDVLATILSIQHERYIRDLSDNVFRGQEGAFLLNFSVGDYCFGYLSLPVPGSEQGRRGRNVKPRMLVAIDQETAAWVVRIFNWFVLEKRSLGWIGRELTRRGAPKDHRASTKEWRHDLVVSALQNRKYVGFWAWGKLKNVRNPMTGQVSQELREEGEWKVRQVPELRIVSDEVFEAAQERLAQNAEAVRSRRRADGTLNGSAGGTSAGQPRHLLSGLLRCAACGGIFYVSGTDGRYMQCRNYRTGACRCKTQVRRDLGEKLLLQAIGDRILQNATWRAAVQAALRAAFRKLQDETPSERRSVEESLAAVKAKIDRLVDQFEEDEAPREIKERLAARRQERQELERRLTELRRIDERPLPEPSDEWIDEQFRNLDELLHSGGPAAALALRALVGGEIRMVEQLVPQRSRHFLRGRFTLQTADVVRALNLQGSLPGGDGFAAAAPNTDEVELEFREMTPEEQIADEVQQLWESGLTYPEISTRVGRHRNMVRAALVLWHTRRGLPVPTGPNPRRKPKPGKSEQLQDDIMKLWHEGWLHGAIAQRLDCDISIVTKSVQGWHRARGLPIPDGRTRRKTLKNDSENRDSSHG